jgi:hypothetical protein
MSQCHASKHRPVLTSCHLGRLREATVSLQLKVLSRLFLMLAIAGASVGFVAIARAETVTMHCSDPARVGVILVDVDLSTSRVTLTVGIGVVIGPSRAKITPYLVSWTDNVGGAHNLSRVTNELMYCNGSCIRLPSLRACQAQLVTDDKLFG